MVGTLLQIQVSLSSQTATPAEVSNLDYSLERVIETYNVELIGQMGNLIQRIRHDKLIKRLPTPDHVFQMPHQLLDIEKAIHNSLSELPGQ